RQLLTEGLLIALLGGGLGLPLSFWGVDYLRANLNFNDEVGAIEYKVDASVVIFTLLISVAAALLCALAPALQAARTDVNTSLKDESRAATGGAARSRLRSVLVAGEIALALFLVMGTGLLLFTVGESLRQELGFSPQHLLT